MAEALLRRHGGVVYDAIEERLCRSRRARDNTAVIYWYFVRTAVDDLLQRAA